MHLAYNEAISNPPKKQTEERIWKEQFKQQCYHKKAYYSWEDIKT